VTRKESIDSFPFYFGKSQVQKEKNYIPSEPPQSLNTHGSAVTYGSLILEIRSLEGSDRMVFGLTSTLAETSCTVTGGNVFIKVMRLAVDRNIPWHNAAAFYRRLCSRERLHRHCLILHLVQWRVPTTFYANEQDIGVMLINHVHKRLTVFQIKAFSE
jgi:hypothetical protein